MASLLAPVARSATGRAPPARRHGALLQAAARSVAAPGAAAPRRRAAAGAAGGTRAVLHFQERSSGMRFGRYVVPPSHFQYDVVDAHAPAEVALRNARDLQPAASAGREGFELRQWPTACDDFSDDAGVVRGYYPEVAQLVHTVLGASQVLPFDHVVRMDPAEGGAADAVGRAHCDYVEETARSRVEQLVEAGAYSLSRKRPLSEGERQELLGAPWALVNVWRSFSEHPVQRSPLAVCDARSVSDRDVAYYEIVYPHGSDRQEENHSLHFNAEQRWYFYPGMCRDECLVFVARDGRQEAPRGVFHAAAELPDLPPEAPARASIEVRAAVFFAGEGDALLPKARFRNGKLIGRATPHE